MVSIIVAASSSSFTSIAISRKVSGKRDGDFTVRTFEPSDISFSKFSSK